MENLKEYNKTWYWWITYKRTPKNFIGGRPIYIFRFRTKFWLWKIAKKSYKWNSN